MSTEVFRAGIAVVTLSLRQELEKRKRRNILRMDGAQFDALLQMIDGLIRKQDTKMRMAIPTVTKLEITQCYIATEDSFKSLEYLF
jgi:hypothetical protein